MMIVKKKVVDSTLPNAGKQRHGGRQSAGREPRPKTAGRKKPPEVVLVEVFQAHWRAVNAKIVRGVDVARDRAHMFFASNDQQRLRAARRYYSLARAAKLASASPSVILRLSEPWFSAARESYGEVEPRRLRKEFRKLVRAEYVALVWGTPTFELPPRWEECSVYPLPDEAVIYGDVYEITAAGLSSGSGLRVCKSVAEPFLKSERQEVEIGIEEEFYENARSDDYPNAEEDWQVEYLEVTDRRAIDVDITEVGNIES